MEGRPARCSVRTRSAIFLESPLCFVHETDGSTARRSSVPTAHGRAPDSCTALPDTGHEKSQPRHSVSPLSLKGAGFGLHHALQLVSSSDDLRLFHQLPPRAGNPTELCSQDASADPPGPWVRSRCSPSWGDGVLGGMPGPGHSAAGSGPEGSAKPSTDPGVPLLGPGSTGPGGGTGNIGTLAGVAGWPPGSVGGAA